MEPVREPIPMSLGARLLNVYAAPVELFEALVTRGISLANWLVPSAIVGLIAVVASLVLFSQPALIQQIRDLQDREIQKAVDQGKMRAQDAEKAREVMQGLGVTITKVAAGAGGVVVAIVSPLWWGLILTLTARWAFRVPVPYLRFVEVAGLANLIVGLGMAVGMFLAVGLGSLFAGPHLGAFVSEFDPSNRGHLALGTLNLFNLWHLVVLMVGTARVLHRPLRPIAVVLGGVWLGYKGIAIILHLGQFAM